MPSRYESPVNPSAANNAHAFMLGMVGWNRKVLELGAAAGHMTRALAEQACRVTAIEYDAGAASDLKEGADEVIVGDLNDPNLLAEKLGEFDVVLAGDVLEHLLMPQDVLNRAAQLLVPGGRVVVSLPNVGHVDLRLSLLQGRFDYTMTGLLDETHVRFFTLKTINEMVKKSGLVMTDLSRVRVPAFESEVSLERSSVPTAVLNAALADPEAETYQFVFTAIKDDGNYRTSQLADRNIELKEKLSRALISRQTAEISLEASQRDCVARNASLVSDTDHMRETLEEERLRRLAAESEIDALNRTRTFRYTRAARDRYERLRRRRVRG